MINADVKYQEAGHWFRHLSTLRRTTMGFLFAATGASIAVLHSKGDPEFETALLFAVGNIVFCIAVLLQEVRLHEMQKRVAEYARQQEGDNGPFIATRGPYKGMKTSHVFMTLCSVFIIFWVVQLIVIKTSKGAPKKAEQPNQAVQRMR